MRWNWFLTIIVFGGDDSGKWGGGEGGGGSAKKPFENFIALINELFSIQGQHINQSKGKVSCVVLYIL